MTVRYVYWQENNQWLGYLEEFPDYWTQGETVDDLKEHLRDLFEDLSQDLIPDTRGSGQAPSQEIGSVGVSFFKAGIEIRRHFYRSSRIICSIGTSQRHVADQVPARQGLEGRRRAAAVRPTARVRSGGSAGGRNPRKARCPRTGQTGEALPRSGAPVRVPGSLRGEDQ